MPGEASRIRFGSEGRRKSGAGAPLLLFKVAAVGSEYLLSLPQGTSAVTGFISKHELIKYGGF